MYDNFLHAMISGWRLDDHELMHAWNWQPRQSKTVHCARVCHLSLSSVYSFSRSCPKTVSRTREVFPTGSTTLLRLQLSRTRECAHRSRHVGLLLFLFFFFWRERCLPKVSWKSNPAAPGLANQVWPFKSALYVPGKTLMVGWGLLAHDSRGHLRWSVEGWASIILGQMHGSPKSHRQQTLSSVSLLKLVGEHTHDSFLLLVNDLQKVTCDVVNFSGKRLEDSCTEPAFAKKQKNECWMGSCV